MTQLANFPRLNQQADVLPAGQSVSSNGPFDCVPTSILASVMWLLHITKMDGTYDPEALKDAAYGIAYQGGTSADHYIPWCASHGVRLYAVECGSNANAVSQAHALLAEQRPVIFTQQDDYCALMHRATWTHVCVFHADTSTSLIAMDPFIAQDIEHSDAEWTQRLRSTQLWTVERIAQQEEEEMIPVISLSNATVANYYEQDGAQWRCKQTNKHLGNDILTFYQLYGGGALCGLTYLGLPLSDEVSIGSGRTMQFFERGALCYDPSHTNDNPPGAGAVYPMHLYQGKAQDPRLLNTQKQLDAVKAQLAKTQPDVQIQAELAQARARLNQIEELAKI